MKETETIIKSTLKSNIPPVVLGLVVWAPSLYLALVKPDSWQIFLIVSTFFLTALYWLTSFRIRFLPEKIEYAPPFGATKMLGYRDIAYVYYKTAAHHEGKKYSALFFLVLETRDGNSIVINVKPFSKQALGAIAQNLAQKCPDAYIDDSVKKWGAHEFDGLELTWQRRGRLLFQLLLIFSIMGIAQGLLRLNLLSQ